MQKRKMSPNSLENLKLGGGKPRYRERKKQRNISVSQQGWEGFHELAKSQGLSLSEMIEKLGRGEFELVRKTSDEKCGNIVAFELNH